MVRLCIIYLLPFLIIYVSFAKLSERFGQTKSAFWKIFFAMLIFFGTQFLVSNMTVFLVLSSDDINIKNSLVLHIFSAQIIFSLTAAAACHAYYKFLKGKFMKEDLLRKDSINEIGQ
ncbi:hypothetical protein ASG01_12835 [Chryseobacterium sp. Leaf180]|uniref:hypothetical protein n=1 Tax=Chryseobacterium sp. Leaf180 TaxID=1736289 RepID=UPI000700223C|nr:hypothetical protein [Chryseobacterium sp. Leaf180]KQR91885.1 hypothetical protein ASG01_12835 [Chryseobacterium sp. Leaf180]